VSSIVTVSVIVPSYRRPERLVQCLEAVRRSELPPLEIIVVLRVEDTASIAAVNDRFPSVELVLVAERGGLAAMTAGARRARGDVLVFFDDDAVPRPDWLPRIAAHLGEDDVGGAGGRDIVTDPDVLPRTTVAGRFMRSGRLIGNHHTITGPPRDVDVLKGANMAFKREAFALPTHLLGDGAQVHFEVAACLWARRRGWRLILDPAAEVLHIPGTRFDSDIRFRPSLRAVYHMAFNFTWCLLSTRPKPPLRAFVYGILVGYRGGPGIVRTAVALLRGERAVLRRVLPSLAGHLHAVALLIAGRRGSMITFPARPAHAGADSENSPGIRRDKPSAEAENSVGSTAPAS
jgi:GT2 family glycosyltransferase